MNVFAAGRAFTLFGHPVGPMHLWFLLTDPDPGTYRVVMVMVVSAQPHTDKTVVLGVGDHPWIRHESNVDFGSARFIPTSKLEAAQRGNRLILQAEMSDQLLSRVRNGLVLSSRTIHEVKDYCSKRFGH